MPRTFKQWTPATAELELLHECWLARLPPQLCGNELEGQDCAVVYFRTEVKTVHAADSCGEGDAPAGTCQAAPSSVIKRRGPAARAHLRRMSGAAGGFSFSWGATVSAAPSRSRLSQIDPKFARN